MEYQAERVIIVGGTHGNELTGIQLVNKYSGRQTPGFQSDWILANTKAIEICQRYSEVDLNRCFRQKDLQTQLPEYEYSRAKEIAEIFGQKDGQKDPPHTDVCIDIHNTTANMGQTLIVSSLDPFMRFVLRRALESSPEVKIYFMPENSRVTSPYLPSLAKYDICLEVGAQAHGTLMGELFFKTEKTLNVLLQAISDWNSGQRYSEEKPFPVYEHLYNVDYPRDDKGELNAMVHPNLQFRDYQALEPGDALFLDFQEKSITWNEDQVVWPVFINEQAYYEKKFAMSLTQKKTYNL